MTRRGRKTTTPQNPDIRELRGDKLKYLREKIWKCISMKKFCEDKERCEKIRISSATALGRYENKNCKWGLDDDHLTRIAEQAQIPSDLMLDTCDIETFKKEIDRIILQKKIDRSPVVDPDDYIDPADDPVDDDNCENKVTKTVPTEKSDKLPVNKDDISGMVKAVAIAGPLGGVAYQISRIYNDFTKKSQPAPTIIDHPQGPTDVHAELVKLDDLRQRNIISEVEFEAQKKKILNAST